jgi:hypothetical protein
LIYAPTPLVYLNSFDDSKDSIEIIQRWLHEKISTFLDNDPRDQTELPGNPPLK